MDWKLDELKEFTNSEYPYVREWGVLKIIDRGFNLKKELVKKLLNDNDLEVVEASVHYIIARNESVFGDEILDKYRKETRPILIKYIIYLAQTSNEKAIPYLIEDFFQKDTAAPHKYIISNAFQIYDHDYTNSALKVWVNFTIPTRTFDEVEDLKEIYDIAVKAMTTHGNLRDILYLYKMFLDHENFRDIFEGKMFDGFLLSNYLQDMYNIICDKYTTNSKELLSFLFSYLDGFKGYLNLRGTISSTQLRELDDYIKDQDSESLIHAMYQHARNRITKEGLLNTDIKSIEYQYPTITDDWTITHYAILELLYIKFEDFKKMDNQNKQRLIFVAISCFLFILGYDEQNNNVHKDEYDTFPNIETMKPEVIWEKIVVSNEEIERVGLQTDDQLINTQSPKIVQAIKTMIEKLGKENIIERSRAIIRDSEDEIQIMKAINIIQFLPPEVGVPYLLEMLAKSYKDYIRLAARDTILNYQAKALPFIENEIQNPDKQKNKFLLDVIFKQFNDEVLQFVYNNFELLYKIDKISTLKMVAQSGSKTFIEKLGSELSDKVDITEYIYTLLCDLNKSYNDIRLNQIREKVLHFRKDSYENQKPYLIDVFSN